MKLITTNLIYILIALGFTSCSKESTTMVSDDIPEIIPTTIEADTTFLLGNQSINVDKAVIRFEKLITDTSATTGNCIFSLVLATEENLSLIALFEYESTIIEGLKEGTYETNIVHAYSLEYLQAIEDWNQNGANPNTKPQFNYANDFILHDDISLTIEIKYITEGQSVNVEEYHSVFGVPLQDPLTNQPQIIRYVKDACIITMSGSISVTSIEDKEISGFLESEYRRQI